MPSAAQVALIATDIYGKTISATTDYTGLTYNKTAAASYGFPTSYSDDRWSEATTNKWYFNLFTAEEHSSVAAGYRDFCESSSAYGTAAEALSNGYQYRAHSGGSVVCLGTD